MMLLGMACTAACGTFHKPFHFRGPQAARSALPNLGGAKAPDGALLGDHMSAIRCEPWPAVITHVMPDDTHTANLHCWCNPRPTNGPQNGSTTVEHTRNARDFHWACKSN